MSDFVERPQCVLCHKPIKEGQIATFEDGQWYDGDWHRKCLPLSLAMFELNKAWRKLGRALLDRFQELWSERWFRYLMIALAIADVLVIIGKVSTP